MIRFRLRALLLVLASGTFVGGAIAIAACTTPDPQAGTKGSGSSGGSTSTSSGTGSSTSGGIDAQAIEGPIECGPSPGAAGAFDKQALLAASAKCAEWNACNFQNAAANLEKALGASPDDARAAWKVAMVAASKLELFRFGPVGSTTQDPYHGRGLLSYVHPWPDTNRCQVETQIATKAWRTNGLGMVLPSARGLFAIEYALFYGGADTACLPASETGKAWSALSASDLGQAKNDYARAVAENVLAVAVEMRNVWRPAPGEDFGAKLRSFDGYGSEQETLNVVAWSLFYVEKEVKDVKLASRAGVTTVPANPETPFALVEIDNVRANLQAFEMLFRGCSADGTGIGFDDWLVAAGQSQLASEIVGLLASARAKADAFPPLETASEAQAKDLYEALRLLSVALKTRLFGSASPLNLKLPAGVASDTD